MKYYINNFLLFSIFGYFFETLLFKIADLHYQSGFMFLCWTPFYGAGVIIAILINEFLKKKIDKKRTRLILLTIVLFCALTILEFLGGYLLEIIHGYSLWNYYMIPLHIGKYISIPTSLAWVLMSLIYLYFIKTFTDKLINTIPTWITILITFIFVVDLILTLEKLLLNHIL